MEYIPYTEIQTEQGNITILHEITLGDIIIAVLLVAFIILNIFNSIRR